MTIIFGTLGFTPDKLLPSLASHGDVTRLVFFHDKEPRSVKAAAQVREHCLRRGIESEAHPLDAFDIIECATKMRERVKRHGATSIVFNVTGGTAVISSAATLTCILEGVRAVYLNEKTGKEVDLPLLTMRYDEILNEEQRRVLALVAKKGKGGCSQADIMRDTKLSRATVSHHVKNLKNKRLLRAVPHKEDSRKEVLTVMESAALLLMGDEK
ncbi:MAG TPA: DUF6293 family protein [Candidatus Thermoplasmatota archaeon]|nr:DUF6293 family protein [Candidatus Thermoplasmatota archaeon]